MDQADLTKNHEEHNMASALQLQEVTELSYLFDIF